jgi:hypothetical protein
MKIKAQVSFIVFYHAFASLVFGGFAAVGISIIVQYAGTDSVVGGIVMTSQFGLFFLTIQVLAILYYVKAERFPVVIENGLVTVRSYKGGKSATFPVSEVSSWVLHLGSRWRQGNCLSHQRQSMPCCLAGR